MIQISIGSFTQTWSFHKPQNAPLGPQTGSGAVPELPQLRDTPRHSGAGPETPCFVSRLVVDSAITCIKGSCNPIRLLEAAELLEADQRKHEEGQSKEMDSTSFGSVPKIFWS